MIQKCTACKTARTLTHLSARWRTQTRIWTAYAKFTPQLESSIQSRAGGKGICLSPCYDPCYTRSNGREDRRRNIYTLPLRTYLCESIIMCLLRCVVVMLQSVNRVFLNTCGRIFFMKQCCHIRTLTNRMSLLHFFFRSFIHRWHAPSPFHNRTCSDTKPHAIGRATSIDTLFAAKLNSMPEK